MDKFDNGPEGPNEEGLPKKIHAKFSEVDPEFWENLRKRNARRTHGVVSSFKVDKALMYRTREERDLLRLLEVDANVETIDVYPEKVAFVVAGSTREHVPAFRIRKGNQTAVIDAMKAGEENSRARQRLNAVIKRLYEERGIVYHAVSRREVRKEPRRTNALHVLSHIGDETPPGDQLLVTEALSRRSPLTVAELEKMVDRPYLRSTIFNMALKRHLVLDLDARSTDLIRVSLRRDA